MSKQDNKKGQNSEAQAAAGGFGDFAPEITLNPMLCMGKPDVGEEVVASDRSDFMWFDVAFDPVGTGRKSRLRLMFKPSWLSRDFNPKKDLVFDADEASDAKKVQQSNPAKLTDEQKEALRIRGEFYVYKNLMSSDGSGNLQRLLGMGTEKANLFPVLIDQMKEVWKENEFIKPEQFRNLVLSLVNRLKSANANWCYLLRQETSKDESGERVKTDRYEITDLVVADKKTLEGMVRRAKKQGYDITFEV